MAIIDDELAAQLKIEIPKSMRKPGFGAWHECVLCGATAYAATPHAINPIDHFEDCVGARLLADLCKK